MSPGPLFRREYRAATRGRRPFVFRLVVTITLAIISVLIASMVFSGPPFDPETRWVYVGRGLVIAVIAVEFLMLSFFIPAFVGGAVAEEREKDTMLLLLLTRLTPIEIVATKAFARWLPSGNLIVCGLPFLVAGAWLAGLEREAALGLLVMVSGSAFMAGLSILASAQREQAANARGQATAWIMAWLILPPVVSILPIATGSIWGDLLYELKRLCVLFAPSSPVSLITDPGWYYRTSALSLEARVAIMVGLQLGFSLLAILLASGRLQARERNPNWLDPTGGFRPRCGDDPIVWREYQLPYRRGSGSLIGIRVRYVWILIRAILMSLLALLAVLIALAVPISLWVGAIYYGQAAFRELWANGYGENGSFDDRRSFNFLIRAATSMLALLPAIFASATVTARIASERDKKTWDAFLTTPLDGQEILSAKAKAAVSILWLSAWPVPIFWALGLGLGVVTFVGVVVTAIDLALTTWLSIALGLYLVLRPGTTAAANSRASIATLSLLVIHAPFLIVALASPREVTWFLKWDSGARVALPIFLSIPIATALLAWWLTRRTLERFDEWSGRPLVPRPGQGGLALLEGDPVVSRES